MCMRRTLSDLVGPTARGVGARCRRVRLAPRRSGHSHESGRPVTATRRRKPMRFPILFASAGALAIAALAGCAASSATAAKDVTITACTASPTGGRPTATGQILNHSSKASAYTIHVKFKDSAGNGVGDGVAAVAKVDHGATASWHADGTLSAKGPLTCSLSSVTRNFSP